MSIDSEDFRTKVTSWAELSELIEHFSLYCAHDWLFRGVTDATYGLQPKIGRTATRARKTHPTTGERKRIPYQESDERAVLSMFKQQARPHLSHAPQNDLEWLAIAQHHGLPTRLLDWTDSLLAAAYFAVSEGGADDTDSAIWVTRGLQSVNSPDCSNPFSVSVPKSYRPPHISPRIAAQGSVFVICPKPDKELKLGFAKKIVVNHQAQFKLKKRLSACGINGRLLFPDLVGLSEHLGWLYKNDWLAGYKETPDEPDES